MIATQSLQENSYYMSNGEWELVSTSAIRHALKYQCCDNEFVDVTVHVKLRRYALNYSLNLIVPCCLLSSLVLLGYILPPESGERIGLMVALLLAVIVFQQLTNQIMPSYDFAYLAQYYWATIVQTGMSLVVTTIVLNCYHHNHKQMHWLVKKVLFHWIGPMIFCKKRGDTDYADSHDSETIVVEPVLQKQDKNECFPPCYKKCNDRDTDHSDSSMLQPNGTEISTNGTTKRQRKMTPHSLCNGYGSDCLLNTVKGTHCVKGD